MIIEIQEMVEGKLNHHHSTKIHSNKVVVLRAVRVMEEHAQEQLVRVVRVEDPLGKVAQMMI